MAAPYTTESEHGVAELLTGIVQDGRQLLTQQLTLFQVEIKNDFRRTLQAVMPMIFGVVVLAVAAPLLGLAAAYFLCWMWPAIPMWAALGGVAGGAVLCGIGLILWGKNQFDAFNPLPDKSLEGLKENIQWKTKT